MQKYIYSQTAMTLSHSTAEDKLTDILTVMNSLTFGFRKAATIVGGRTRLQRLIEKGEIRTEKRSMSQNGKLYCNASDVLIHVVNTKRKSNK